MLQSLQGPVSLPASLFPPFMFQTLIWSSNTTLKLEYLPVTRPMASFLISPPSFHWFGDTLRVCSWQPTVSQPNAVRNRKLSRAALENALEPCSREQTCATVPASLAASAATVSVASAPPKKILFYGHIFLSASQFHISHAASRNSDLLRSTQRAKHERNR